MKVLTFPRLVTLRHSFLSTPSITSSPAFAFERRERRQLRDGRSESGDSIPSGWIPNRKEFEAPTLVGLFPCSPSPTTVLGVGTPVTFGADIQLLLTSEIHR